MGSNTMIKQNYKCEYDYHIYKLGTYISIKKTKKFKKKTHKNCLRGFLNMKRNNTKKIKYSDSPYVCPPLMQLQTNSV